MSKRVLFIFVAVASLGAAAAAALELESRDPVPALDNPLSYGAPVQTARTVCDTLYLLGGPDRWDGRFENSDGTPNWHGWTSEDRSIPNIGVTFWQVSGINAVNGQYSMWCGTLFDNGTNPGYGNDWDQRLVFTQQVENNQAPTTVHWTATVQYDTEPGYDYTFVEWNEGGNWQVLARYDGIGTDAFDETFTVNPGDYVGNDADEVQIRIRFYSDGAWSDEDGLWDTDGACQVDDITVVMNSLVIDTEDFEDAESQCWIPETAPGVGDFAQLWFAPGDLDPCVDNLSWQVVFVDDGIIVPGTGGSVWLDQYYGPGGFITNWNGGLMGPSFYLSSHIVSPPLAMPVGYEGAHLEFDVWRDCTLANYYLTPIYYTWKVRSTTSSNPHDLEIEEWRDDYFVYYGGPDYHRFKVRFSAHLEPGTTWLQVSLGAREFYTMQLVQGATPAPYFDNVAVKVFEHLGPSVTVAMTDLPGDAFPSQRFLDLADLAGNSCRFDAAITGGDSLAVVAVPLRQNAELSGPPTLHATLLPNPVFDAVRVLPPGFVLVDGQVRGSVEAEGEDSDWWFDLPDEGFLFPGDELHFLIEARDLFDGVERATIWPADTTGFDTFKAPDDPAAYDPLAVLRCLPTVDAVGAHPSTLVWNDAGEAHGAWWARRLAEAAGLVYGVDYDLFTTRAAESSGVGGLAAESTIDLLAGYGRLLYTSGDLETGTLGDGYSLPESSDDIGLLSSWLNLGRDLVLFGDGWLTDCPSGAAFLANCVGVDAASGNQLHLLDGQESPRARALAGNGVLDDERQWMLFGACPQKRRFDLMIPADASPLAEYLTPSGQGGVYETSPLTLMQHTDPPARVIAASWDLRAASAMSGQGAYGASTASLLLRDILAYLDVGGVPVGVVPDAGVLAIGASPNPFNPRTEIDLTMPRAGEARVCIFDLKGRLVRTLHDGPLTSGHHTWMWQGRDDRGAAVASGVYMYGVRVDDNDRFGKLTLVR